MIVMQLCGIQCTVRGAAKRILVFEGDPHAVDGEGVVLVFVSVVVAGNVALHGRDVCDVLHAKRRAHVSLKEKWNHQTLRYINCIISDRTQ